MGVKITRATQKVFAGDVVATNNIAMFGSLKAGTPTYTNDPATLQSLDAFKYGWGSAVVNNQAPALQDVNAIDFLFSRQIAYLLAQGIAEYDAGTEYFQFAMCSNNGIIYQSKTDNNLNNAVTDTTKWLSILAPNTSGGALGNVPLGSVIAIGNQQAWALPASAEVKDGYALCNGQTFLGLGAGNYNANFTGNLPTISDNRFLMGGTAIGAVGGANSFTLAAGNIPQISTSYTPAGTNAASSVSGTTNIGHSHGASTVTGTVDISHSHAASSISGTAASAGSHNHRCQESGVVALSIFNNTAQQAGGAGKTVSNSGTPMDTDVQGAHTHSVSGTANGQTLGSTPISIASGSAAGQTLGTSNIALASGVAAGQGFTGTAATITVGTASPTAIENRPLYFTCVFVMRVK